MVYAKQWARCYIKHYRNIGVWTGLPTELTHNQFKTYLTSTKSGIDTVYGVVEKMCDERFVIYT